MSRKPWLFDAENVPELEEYSSQEKTAEIGLTDWESYTGGDDTLFEVPSPGGAGFRRSREELLRQHLRWRRERSHGQR